jgi:uncharacterized protein
MGMRDESGQLRLQCPVCDGLEFETQESRQNGRWGLTSHRMTLHVCRECRYVLHFHDAHSIFNPG